MHPWASAAVHFATGFWFSVLIAQAVAIYAFDQFELAWGKGASLQVASWVITGVAVLVLFSGGLGFKVGARRGTVPKKLGAFVLGIIFTVLLCVAMCALSFVVPKFVSLNAVTAAGILSVSSAAVCYASTRAEKYAA